MSGGGPGESQLQSKYLGVFLAHQYKMQILDAGATLESFSGVKVWRVQINVGRSLSLGSYKTEKEAASAHDLAILYTKLSKTRNFESASVAELEANLMPDDVVKIKAQIPFLEQQIGRLATKPNAELLARGAGLQGIVCNPISSTWGVRLKGGRADKYLSGYDSARTAAIVRDYVLRYHKFLQSKSVPTYFNYNFRAMRDISKSQIPEFIQARVDLELAPPDQKAAYMARFAALQSVQCVMRDPEGGPDIILPAKNRQDSAKRARTTDGSSSSAAGSSSAAAGHVEDDDLVKVNKWLDTLPPDFDLEGTYGADTAPAAAAAASPAAGFAAEVDDEFKTDDIVLDVDEDEPPDSPEGPRGRKRFKA